MKIEVVVETELDKLLLETILKAIPEAQEFEFRYFVANSRNRLSIVARTIIVGVPHPLLVVMDADTNDPELARIRKQELESYLNWVTPAQPYRILVALPELEIVFFADPSIVESKLKDGRKLTAVEQNLTQSAPKQLLQSLARERLLPDVTVLLSELTDDDITKMSQHRLFQEVVSFLKSVAPRQRSKAR
ncbi:hypothetical protein [Gloeobacter kilaueensis]|uniref:Uncharacterized protein n=1 Tax=Gloeobacter kilaueensis (strain ATCC BAA-2537 / CCAP 1431/1 / ULC 316 / JS1) TaxID=1183438 RepID=U5QH51_GLOK1|nr:hypothetical protein [Gloeobacter kilaueensis]AGY56939.1 hypothetical protein GKIL_0693 [Gloeobacter kilaueensis JS1]